MGTSAVVIQPQHDVEQLNFSGCKSVRLLSVKTENKILYETESDYHISPSLPPKIC